MVDSKGALWVAGWPDLSVTGAHLLYPAHITRSPSNVFKITLNTPKPSFYGEKEKDYVQRVLEDDGSKISGINSVVHDATRGWLFMHGVVEEGLIICQTK